MRKEFYEEIDCEHGWTDKTGFPQCGLGSAMGICDKIDCPLIDEEEAGESVDPC